MYGGRAIDDFDRRVLKTYMDEYMGDFIFDTFQPFHFYHNPEVDYVIPPDGTRDSYMEYIDTLPLANTPEVFGLHTNAEIGYFTRAAKNMWAQLMELQPQTGEASTGMSREEFIGNIASDIQVRDICACKLLLYFLECGTYCRFSYKTCQGHIVMSLHIPEFAGENLATSWQCYCM